LATRPPLDQQDPEALALARRAARLTWPAIDQRRKQFREQLQRAATRRRFPPKVEAVMAEIRKRELKQLKRTHSSSHPLILGLRHDLRRLARAARRRRRPRLAWRLRRGARQGRFARARRLRRSTRGSPASASSDDEPGPAVELTGVAA
jgi:hypothetical protein